MLGAAIRAASWSTDEAIRLGLGFILLMYRLMIRFCEDDSDSMYGCNLHMPTCMSASPALYCNTGKRWDATARYGIKEVVNHTAAHAQAVVRPGRPHTTNACVVDSAGAGSAEAGAP